VLRAGVLRPRASARAIPRLARRESIHVLCGVVPSAASRPWCVLARSTARRRTDRRARALRRASPFPSSRSALRGLPVTDVLIKATGLGKAYPKAHRAGDRLRALGRLLFRRGDPDRVVVLH